MDTTIQSISPQQAWQMMQENPKSLLIDIRSTMEYLFVGHPKGAVHIAWIDEPDWDINPDFLKEIRKLVLGGISCTTDEAGNVTDCTPILLICRSGKRSLEAGKCLIEGGFSNVYNVLEGFEGPLDAEHHRSTQGGWRYHGLPWEQC